jgi:PAS domain S-box-containing protein
LRDLIAEREPWLVARILAYARERGYAKYTSTLEEAWRASIAGLSGPLMECLGGNGSSLELSPDDDFASDPLSAFGVLEARRHRERGVTLPMFLGLMKYYRQSYIDLLREAGFPGEQEEMYRRLVTRFFDRVEVAFCSEWERTSGESRVAELSAVNRAMTNEKNKYLTLFESLPTPVVLLDRDGRIDNANHTAAELLGGDATPGTRYYAAEGKGEGMPFLAEEVSRFLAAGVPSRRCEKVLGTSRGARRYRVEMHRMLDVSGKFDGAVVIFNDLTQRREAEETLQVVLDEMEARIEERTAELAEANRQLQAQVAERDRAEKELAKNLILLRAVVENTTDAVYVKDLEGRYRLMNPSGAQPIGRTIPEILGRDDVALFPPDTARLIVENDREILREGMTRSYVEDIVDAEGGRRTYISVKGVYRDENGAAIGLFGVSRDITGIREVERKLRRVNRALNLLWGCAQALLRAKEEGPFLSRVCRVAVATGGYRLAWVGYAGNDPGKTVRPVAQAGYEEGYLENVAISWADSERGRGPVGTAIRTGKPFIVRDVHSDPLFAPWQAEALLRGYQSVLGLPLISGDHAFGALAIYSEEPDAFDEEEVRLLEEMANGLSYGIRALRTEAERRHQEERRAALEAQLRRSQRMESVGRLAGGVAHNLNNLLMVINGYRSMLEKGIPVDDPKHRMLEEMRQAGDRAAELTEQLLAFGRRQMLQPRDVEIDRLVGEVEPALRAACGGNVELSIDADASGAAIRIDTEGFRHMVTRLAASAYQGMRGVGSLVLRTTVAELEASDAPADINFPPGGYVVLTFRDTGPGMDEESLSRVFDPFHRSLETGAGLELASVYGFVKQSGGYIWATSAPGKGTTFTVCFPRGGKRNSPDPHP